MYNYYKHGKIHRDNAPSLIEFNKSGECQIEKFYVNDELIGIRENNNYSSKFRINDSNAITFITGALFMLFALAGINKLYGDK